MTRILCLGDSLTDCGRLFDSPPLGNGYVSLLDMYLKLQKKNIEVINCGVDGFTLQRLIENVSSRYLPLKPDMITILIGINDLALMMNTNRTEAQKSEMLHRFYLQYRQLLQSLSVSCRQLILIEPFLFSYPQEYLTWMPYLKQMIFHIRSLADEYHLPVLSMQETYLNMTEEKGIADLTSDGVHLTSYGHKLLAEALLPVLNL